MGMIETAKDITKLAQQLGSIEIQEKVIELQSQMLDLQKEVQTLRVENRALKDTEKIDQELTLEENAYWQRSAPATRQGAFCTRCWDAERKLIRMKDHGSARKCPKCGNFFETSTSDDAPEASSVGGGASDEANVLGQIFGRDQ